MNKAPRFIALCGNPQAGKTEIQRILAETFGVVPGDDGWPLRAACMEAYSLTKEQVTTQAGKASYIDVCGKQEQVRKLLGDMGMYLEQRHDINIMAHLAIAVARKNPDFGSIPAFCFGSVRRWQGQVYNSQPEGGMTIEVRRPGKEPSGNEFDKWDASAVSHVIDNDGTVADLEAKVIAFFGPYFNHIPIKKAA